MKKFAIVAGEPRSINTEIISKAWKRLKKFEKKNFFIIGSYSLIKSQIKSNKIKILVHKFEDKSKINSNSMPIMDVPISFKNNYKIPKRNSSKYVLECLNRAHHLSCKYKIVGFINCAIDKKRNFKFKKMGVTEYLSKKSKLNNTEVMMIYNKKLSVVPLTTHISIKKVSSSLNKSLIHKKVVTIYKNYKKIFKINPKIAVLGLNPHNDEFRAYSEEKKIILPAIIKLKKQKYNVSGPFSADTIFMNLKKYNIILGMYHDQVLTPFKALFKFDAINITLGLKYLRVSPDHGTAENIIGQNKANPSSLISCIKFFLKR